MSPRARYIFVTPSLQTSGGNLEIIKLARQLRARGAEVDLVAIWATPHAVDTGDVPVHQLSNAPFRARHAALQMPALIAGFRRLLAARRGPGLRVVLSHYTSFPLGWVVPRAQRWFFVQDTEWNFVPPGPRRMLTRSLILAHLRRGRVLTTNAYLSDAMRRERIEPAARIGIWADCGFLGDPDRARPIDIVVVLRRGAHKRADLTRSFVRLCAREWPTLRLAAITPEPDLLDGIEPDLAEYAVRPDRGAMRDIYERSRLLLLLSEHEGFGLPPLEAMGSGCVPLCRDSGGIRSYMTGALAENIVPLGTELPGLLDRAVRLLGDAPLLTAQSQLAVQLFRDGLAAFDMRLDDAAAGGFVADPD